jgi:CubicO group peptidase (beta-lactamase class C family)
MSPPLRFATARKFLALASISVLWASIASGQSVASAEENPSAWTFTTVTEENVAQAVDALPSIIADMQEKTGVPGIAVAVTYQGEIIFAEGYGERIAGSGQLVDADTVFLMASVSKPVGATAISRIVQEETIAWDDPIRDYLPGFRMKTPDVSRNVTIADMYSHRSGLPPHAGDDLEDIGYSRTQIFNRLRYLPLTSFRNTYNYTNFGMTVGAQAASNAAGLSWAALTRTKLFEPAGMNSSSFLFADYANATNKALSHMKKDGTWVHGETRNAQPQSPAGGLSSTVNDMARWMLLHLDNGVLDGTPLIDPDVLQEMRRPHAISGPASNPIARSSMYGFGIGTSVDGTGHVRWSHSGAFFLGAATTFEMLPAAKLGIVVLSNGQPLGLVEAISASFMDIATTGAIQLDWFAGYSRVFAPMLQDPSVLAGRQPPPNAQPRYPLSDYAGTYRNGYVGTARVVRAGSGLALRLGPKGQQTQFPLTAWGGNLFSYRPTGENALGPSAVWIRPNQNSITIEQLNTRGMGTLIRR